MQENFDPPLFMREGTKVSVDLARTPYFGNIGGHPAYFEKLPDGVTELLPASHNPDVALGNEYQVQALSPEMPDPNFGDQTRLIFEVPQVEYKPLPATRENAAAFGFTLVEAGQGICIDPHVPLLTQVDYEYGMFAGHRSPYQGTGYQLLGSVCTDLEYHEFPHVFASVDPHLPLVISVGRYWPNSNKICLADLWVPCGSALYSPSRFKPTEPQCLDLHGNRNSALACWPGIQRSSIHTKTLLRTDGGFFHWFWSELPTIHPLLK